MARKKLMARREKGKEADQLTSLPLGFQYGGKSLGIQPGIREGHENVSSNEHHEAASLLKRAWFSSSI